MWPGPDLPSDWTFASQYPASGFIGVGAFGDGFGPDIVTAPSPIVLATISFTINSVAAQTVPLEIVPSFTTTSGTVITMLDGRFQPIYL